MVAQRGGDAQAGVEGESEATPATAQAEYLRYLGHIISHTEVFSDPKKVEAIREMPAPRTKKDVRCWLGMCNYYRPYICNYGKMAID